MKKIVFIFPLALFVLIISSCNAQNANINSENTRSIGATTKKGTFKNVDAKAFANLANDANNILIDVRTPGEFAQGHIKGARLINVSNYSFSEKINKLDKNKTYLVYCRSGSRSRRAVSKMKAAGFTNIYNLQGGIRSWVGPGMKLVR